MIFSSKPGNRRSVLAIKCGSKVDRRSLGHIQLYPSGVGNHRLLAVAVSAVASLAVRKMMVYLRIQRPLGQRFLQIVQKAIRIKGRLGISATKKLIENGIRGSVVPCVGPWDRSFLPIVPKPHTKFRTVPGRTRNGVPTSPISGHARAGSTLPSSLTSFARRVVGWAAGDRLHKELALLALRRAVAVRCPSVGSFTTRTVQPILLHRVPGRAENISISMSGGGNGSTTPLVDVLQDPQGRTRLAHHLPEPDRSGDRNRPLHRRLLQSRPPPFGARLHQPASVLKGGQRKIENALHKCRVSPGVPVDKLKREWSRRHGGHASCGASTGCSDSYRGG